ncbi:MAG: hypothetical protein J0G28_09780 [Afipia sp.]|nr:hypothetical protein [Afipia sp.]OJW60322.1 MAG: hypothetical protein BGO65_06360 [Afipia sp. 64-13]
MATRNPSTDNYESVIDEAIATCGGDMRGALKALLAANEHLEAELARLRAVAPRRTIIESETVSPRAYLN